MPIDWQDPTYNNNQTSHSNMNTSSRMRNRPRIYFPVEIEFDDRIKTLAVARNISPEGMLLEIDCECPPNNQNIWLTCRLKDQRWRIQANVINATSRGLGIKFREPQPSLVRTLCAALPKLTQPIAGRFSLA